MRKKLTKKTPAAKRARKPRASVQDSGAFQIVIDAFASDPSVRQAMMFGAVGLRTGSKYFALLYKGALVLKLPAERVQEIVQSGEGTQFDPGHGRLMKEWVALKVQGGPAWIALSREARRFVGGRDRVKRRLLIKGDRDAKYVLADDGVARRLHGGTERGVGLARRR